MYFHMVTGICPKVNCCEITIFLHQVSSCDITSKFATVTSQGGFGQVSCYDLITVSIRWTIDYASITKFLSSGLLWHHKYVLWGHRSWLLFTSPKPTCDVTVVNFWHHKCFSQLTCFDITRLGKQLWFNKIFSQVTSFAMDCQCHLLCHCAGMAQVFQLGKLLSHHN